jgi:CRP/FNR family cyclic AMP-dependent transcriptional regulator
VLESPSNCCIRDNLRVNTYPVPGVRVPGSPYRLHLWEILPAEVVQRLRREGVSRQFRDGALIMQRGQPVTGMLVLEQGRLRAVTHTPHGGEHLIRWIEPGEAVGVASVLTGLPFQTDLVSSGDSQALWVAGEAVLGALRRSPEAGIAMSRFLGARLSEALELMATQSQGRLEDRLRAALEHFAIENGEVLPDRRVRLRLTQEDMARAVGASRQRVNQALKRLQVSGEVEVGYRCLVIQRPPTRSPR